MIIGIDIGGTHFRIGEIENGKVISSKKIKTYDVFTTYDVIGDLSKAIKDFVQDKKIDAISIGFPGTIDKERKKVVQIPNIKDISNIAIVDELTKVFNVPVYLERDTNMLLYYDVNKYGLSNEECVVGIYFGTGVGSAIFMNGKPYNGANGTAGELGHIPVDGNPLICGCGNIGCMETIAGGKYLSKINKEIFRGDLNDIFKKYVGHEVIKRYIERMSMAVATYINTLDPDYVLIGGGIVGMPNFPVDLLKERIIYHTRKPEPANSLKLIFADDEADKGIMGAYYYSQDK